MEGTAENGDHLSLNGHGIVSRLSFLQAEPGRRPNLPPREGAPGGLHREGLNQEGGGSPTAQNGLVPVIAFWQQADLVSVVTFVTSLSRIGPALLRVPPCLIPICSCVSVGPR